MDRRWFPAALFAIFAITSISGADAAEELDDLRAIFPIVNETLEHGQSGIAVPWSNPGTGNSGEITVLRTYFKDDGTPCRDYRRTVETSAGAKGVFEGTGCRIDEGLWQFDESELHIPTQATPSPTKTPAKTQSERTKRQTVYVKTESPQRNCWCNFGKRRYVWRQRRLQLHQDVL